MLTVGIGEYAISSDENESIITHALGSCVALIVHCPITKKTILAHIVLPVCRARDDNSHLDDKPGYFADIIVPKIAEHFLVKNKCKPSQLQVCLAGGADALNENDIFRVGMRNTEMIRTILKKYKLIPYKMDTGGNVSRTVSVDILNGQVTIKKRNMIL